MSVKEKRVRIPENKVVLAKLSREEYSRLKNYCEIKGETVNATIKKIVMSEIDKPLETNEEFSSGQFTNIMFDTNSFDKLLSGEIPLDLIKKSVGKGFKYFITHVQTDELSNIPDNKKDKRAQLILFLSSVAPSLIPTESFILGYSRFGFSKLGTAGYYEKLLNESKNNIKDAIIGDTAIKNRFILVTEDKKFVEKIESLKGVAMTPQELIQKLKEEK